MECDGTATAGTEHNLPTNGLNAARGHGSGLGRRVERVLDAQILCGNKRRLKRDKRKLNLRTSGLKVNVPSSSSCELQKPRVRQKKNGTSHVDGEEESEA